MLFKHRKYREEIHKINFRFSLKKKILGRNFLCLVGPKILPKSVFSLLFFFGVAIDLETLVFAVFGEQSSGKKSLIEAITGLDLPRHYFEIR